MKKLVAIIGVISSVICANANEPVELSASSADTIVAGVSPAKTSLYYDCIMYADEGDTIRLIAVPNNGIYLGSYVGADYFNSNFTPVIGTEVGYHGKHFRMQGGIDFGISKYDRHGNTGHHELMASLHGEVGVKIANLPARYRNQNEIWGIVGITYKVCNISKKFSLWREEDVYSVTCTDVEYVNRSAIAYSGGVLVNFKRFAKSSNLYVKAVVYAAPVKYDGANVTVQSDYSSLTYCYCRPFSEVKFGGSFTVGINFHIGNWKIPAR